MAKPILCLDFDGVIHSYTSGWKGADKVPDPSVPLVGDFIHRASDHFTVAIYSSRSGQPGGIKAMQGHVLSALYWDMPEEVADAVFALIEWPTEKPPAMVTIDDRAITFTGKWPTIEELLAFKPWNKSPPNPAKFLVLPDGKAVCIGGRFDGWLMWKHPDGQWVSVQRLDVEQFVEPDWMKGL